MRALELCRAPRARVFWQAKCTVRFFQLENFEKPRRRLASLQMHQPDVARYPAPYSEGIAINFGAAEARTRHRPCCTWVRRTSPPTQQRQGRVLGATRHSKAPCSMLQRGSCGSCGGCAPAAGAAGGGARSSPWPCPTLPAMGLRHLRPTWHSTSFGRGLSSRSVSVDTAASSSSASAATTTNGAVAAGGNGRTSNGSRSNGSSSNGSGFDRQAIHLAIDEEMHTAFEAEMGAMNKVGAASSCLPAAGACWVEVWCGFLETTLLPDKPPGPAWLAITTLTLLRCRRCTAPLSRRLIALRRQ